MLLNIKSSSRFKFISCHPTHQMCLIVPYCVVSLSSKRIGSMESYNTNCGKAEQHDHFNEFLIPWIVGEQKRTLKSTLSRWYWLYSRRGTNRNACCDFCTSAEPSNPHNLHFIGFQTKNPKYFQHEKQNMNSGCSQFWGFFGSFSSYANTRLCTTMQHVCICNTSILLPSISHLNHIVVQSEQNHLFPFRNE